MDGEKLPYEQRGSVKGVFAWFVDGASFEGDVVSWLQRATDTLPFQQAPGEAGQLFGFMANASSRRGRRCMPCSLYNTRLLGFEPRHIL